MERIPIARTNRLPDSLPVVISLLERHPEGVTIQALQEEIQENQMWGAQHPGQARSLYHRIYGVLKLLRGKGLVRRTANAGRGTLWSLDTEESARQRRREMFEMIQPFVNGCLMISDSRQLLSQLTDLVQDGTLDEMLAERRSKGRVRP